MPTYEYETIPANVAEKPRRFELFQRMSEAPLSHDPATGVAVRRVISGGAAVFGAPGDPGDPRPGAGPCGHSCACHPH